MADPVTPTPPVDASFQGVIDTIVELMKTGVRPDVMEAQSLLLQRLANQGDVFPSRVPAPLNITEVGGYLNLLESGGFFDMRASAVAGALGVAGPPAGAAGLGGVVPIGFVDLANDRPAGAVQASIPPLVSVRADFFAPLSTALATIHAKGCMLPLRARRAALPANQPGATASSLDMEAVLAAMGRKLEIFPGTVLVDPTVDALAIARLETPATTALQLLARELDGGSLVPEQSFVAVRGSASAVSNDAAAPGRYLDVAPIVAAAGWVQPQPLVAPTSLTVRGSLVQFINFTGLVAGETKLGGELELLYPATAIARSALANFSNWVWDGTAFVAPV